MDYASMVVGAIVAYHGLYVIHYHAKLDKLACSGAELASTKL
jgi:hypothetical protein